MNAIVDITDFDYDNGHFKNKEEADNFAAKCIQMVKEGLSVNDIVEKLGFRSADHLLVRLGQAIKFN